jgi:hypothetical protein
MTGQKAKRDFIAPSGAAFPRGELRYDASVRKAREKGASR